MYSYEVRIRAVELYIKLGKRVRPTIVSWVSGVAGAEARSVTGQESERCATSRRRRSDCGVVWRPRLVVRHTMGGGPTRQSMRPRAVIEPTRQRDQRNAIQVRQQGGL